MFQRFSDEFSNRKPRSDFLPNLVHPFSSSQICTQDGESLFRAFGRTFTADVVPGEPSRAKRDDACKPDLHSWLLGRADPALTPYPGHQASGAESTPPIPFEEARRVYIRDLAAVTTQVLSNVKVHDFLISERKRMGLCPRGTVIGDLICIVLGSEVPLVLRPSAEEYLLVGAAYVHGIMDGEAMAEAETIGWRDFTLI